MLVRDGFDARGARGAGELGDLRGVQVVRGGETGDSEIEELGGGDSVGGVEAEIADERRDERGRASASSRPAERTRMGQSQLSRKSAMRSSPGLRTRGLAMRGARPAARTRSSEGRRP